MVTVTFTGEASQVKQDMVVMAGSFTVAPTLVLDKPPADKATKDKKEKPAETSAPVQAPSETKTPLQDATSQVAYADTLDGVTGVITAIAAKESLGKPAAVKLLAEFGVKRGKEVPPEKFAEFVKKGVALLA